MRGSRFFFMLLLIFTACSRKTDSGMPVQSRLTSGGKLLSISGSCPNRISANVKADGYFAIEKGAFVIAVTEGSCKSKVSFSAQWMHPNRVRLARPRALESCGALKLDARSELILDFEQSGADVRLFSSKRSGCTWLRWQKG